jgi:hypothetical protein
MRKITVVALAGVLALGVMSLTTKPAQADIDFFFGFGVPLYVPPTTCHDYWGRPYYCYGPPSHRHYKQHRHYKKHHGKKHHKRKHR